MNSDTQGKQTWKYPQQVDPGTSVGVSQDGSTGGGNLKDTRTLVPSFEHAFLIHAFWAVFAWLLVMYAVNDFRFTSNTPESSESFVSEKDDAAKPPISLPQETGSSSPGRGSHAHGAELSPQFQPLINMVSNACPCLIATSNVDVGRKIVTVVCIISRMNSKKSVILISSHRQKQSLLYA